MTAPDRSIVAAAPAATARPLAAVAAAAAGALASIPAIPSITAITAITALTAVIACGVLWPAPAAAAPAAAPAPSAAAPSAPAHLYAVRLARPSVVGQKQLAVGALETTDLSKGGLDGAEPIQREERTTIRFVVATEVLEVSPRGNVRRAALTVRRLDKESGGLSVELAKPGEIFFARMSGHDRVVEQQGTPVAADLQQALAAAVPLRSDDEPTDDDLYGATQQHKVGDSWPVAADVFARFGAQLVTFDPKQVGGTVTLAAVKPVNGTLCMEVRWKVEAHRGSFKSGNLPGGLLGTLATMTVTGSATVPVDAGLPPLGRANVIAAGGDFTGTSADGASITVHRDLRQSSRVEYSRIP